MMTTDTEHSMVQHRTVERETFASEYVHYSLEMTFRLECIFVFLAAQHVGSVCMATFMMTWQIFR